MKIAPPRIAVGGFLHETHSFAPRPTRLADFRQPAGFPWLQRGPGLLDALRPVSVPCAGAITVAEAAGATLVPLTWCFANPAGPIQDEAFEAIAAMLCADLADALADGGLDGVYLDLHGAALNVTYPDAEGELLRRVRAITGPDLPLTISLDPHANLTPAMVALTDAVVPFRTYPHVDMRDAGAQAMRLLLQRIERGRPWGRALRQVDFFLPLGTQCTLLPPMAEVMAERAALAEAHDCAELAFCFGFPYADFHDCGAAIAAYAVDDTRAAQAADAFAAAIARREMQFVQDILPADQAILRHVGIEPAETPILVRKSSVHFRADFGPIASRVIVAAAPGPVVADPATLPFRNLRPNLRLRPGAN